MKLTPPLPNSSIGFLNRLSPRQRKLVTLTGVGVVFVIASTLLQSVNPTLPDIHLQDVFDKAIEWATVELDVFFDAIKIVVVKLLIQIENFFLWVPWLVAIPAIGLAGYRVLSARSGVLFMLGLALIVSMGLWDKSMQTVALVATSMVLVLLVAIPTGIAASKSDRFDGLLRPMLDAMQTTPAFVYLIPIIFLLGAGKVPAVVATMIYAVPPAVRLTNLGLRQVSPEIKEAARSFGATPWQMLTKVELPLALKTIMAGVNQATMMAVAMVVIAALIGAEGLGNEVLFAMGRVRVGQGIEAGLAILILVVILDRLTQAFGDKGEQTHGE